MINTLSYFRRHTDESRGPVPRTVLGAGFRRHDGIYTFVGVTSIIGLLCLPLYATSKDSYIQKANRELQEWNTKVDDLQKRSQKAGAETRVELDRAMHTVQENLDILSKKVTDLNGSGQSGWANLRRGADQAFKDVKHAYREATSFLDKDKKKEKP